MKIIFKNDVYARKLFQFNNPYNGSGMRDKFDKTQWEELLKIVSTEDREKIKDLPINQCHMGVRLGIGKYRFTSAEGDEVIVELDLPDDKK